jgi:threonine/homoserine/homoserine lactone efflux protein
MPIENYIAFVIASIIVLIIPGPSIIMAVGQAIAHGKRAVAPTVWGVVAGDLIATTLSMLGVGTILLASSEAFQIIKWAGVIYLIYIGISMIRNAGKAEASETQSVNQLKSPKKCFAKL